jgi:hypothetical protein
MRAADGPRQAQASPLPGGFWLPERLVPPPAAVACLVLRPDDIVIAGRPKCGTTWLNALAFAMARAAGYPPAGADHSLIRLNPHDGARVQCVRTPEQVLFLRYEELLRDPSKNRQSTILTPCNVTKPEQ